MQQINDPGELLRACRPFVESRHQAGQTVFLVGNGGNKLTPIGLLFGWSELAPHLIYGDTEPAVCWSFTDGFRQPPLIGPYQRHTLDLDDVLTASGHVRHGEEGRRIWPGPLPADLAAEPYGRDTAFTCRLHADHHARAQCVPTAERVSFADVMRLLPARRLNGWRQTVLDRFRSPDPVNDESLAHLYHAACNLDRDARHALATAGVNRPAAAIGPAFERTVARRTHAWLERTQHPAVQSLWFQPKVARQDRPSEPAAELDVLLVLRNGVLWHLECKSATVERKELDARLLNLQRAGSQPAHGRVRPHPDGARGRAVVRAFAWSARRVLSLGGGLPFLSFTMPGQPASYIASEPDGVSSKHDCLPFEESLANNLQQYVLAQT